MTIAPGRAFWSAFTAFAASVGTLIGVDQLHFSAVDISVGNWWSAVLSSLFVGGIVYGREKVAELRKPNGTM